jgi:cysteinyl-tRNA synthetase
MRPFRLYDTLSRETRLFVPIVPPKIGLFVCGLTPYDEAHIGHGRTAIVFDVVARALQHWGYRVFYVQNVTNIDDRLIARGAEEGVDPLKLAERHFLAWRASLAALGARSVNYFPFATDYIPEIVEQIQALVDKGFAYPAMGSVYYEVAKFPAYGRLSGQRLEEAKPGTRVETEPGKRAPEDFVLWKAARPGEPSWESPWGPGRPGWHIEDTAITHRLLGARYDLHGGGLDLKFPHHEAEIAQAEAATGEAPLVNYWMHAGMLRLRGEKMSKSLGNVVSLEQAIAEHGAPVLRFFYLNAHYRSPLDYVEGESLEQAGEAYDRLAVPAERLAEAAARGEGGVDLPPELTAASAALVESLDATLADDFNTREAIAALYGWTRSVQSWLSRLDELSAPAIESLRAPFGWARTVLGLFEGAGGEDRLRDWDPLIQVAIAARQRARARKDFAESDRIREALRAAGVLLEDEEGGTRWRFERGTAP